MLDNPTNNMMKLTYNKSKNGWGSHGRVRSYIGTVPNTVAGQSLIKELKTAFKPYGSLQLRGRNPNRKQLAITHGLDHEALRQDVPAKYATSFDVYFHRRGFSYTTSFRGVPKFQDYTLFELQELNAE
jgi:hypothetical protein